jgi:hypothetical protein
MPKHYPVKKNPASLESAEPGDAVLSTSTSTSTELGDAPSFWILKTATAKKLGKRSEGNISYQLLADADHQHLFLAITGNESGGYFSRARVPFQKVRECLSRFPDKSFPSKALKDSFFGRSSNNPGFLAAVLSAEGLIAADATAESLHKAIGDWLAWEQTMLALPGIRLEVAAAQALPDTSDAMPDHTQTADTTEVLPAKARKGGKHITEASHAGDTPSE